MTEKLKIIYSDNKEVPKTGLYVEQNKKVNLAMENMALLSQNENDNFCLYQCPAGFSDGQ